MSMDRKSAGELQAHMLGTYYTLRWGLAAIGFALPVVVLLAGGFVHHVWLEPSISQYYHTRAQIPFFTTRDLFVGGLFAAAACLYLYKGFSTRENVVLNLAGIFAVLVAVLPTAATRLDRGLVSVLHGTAAVLFFLCIAYVSLFRARDTLRLLPPEKRARYARRYVWTGLAMVASPVAAVVLSYALDPRSPTRAVIFLVETLGVWAFATYWIVKTGEMRETGAERRALDAQLRRAVVPTTPPIAAGTAITASTDGAPGAILRKLASKSGEVEQIVPAHEPAPQ
jgi:hypothetical protein